METEPQHRRIRGCIASIPRTFVITPHAGQLAQPARHQLRLLGLLLCQRRHWRPLLPGASRRQGLQDAQAAEQGVPSRSLPTPILSSSEHFPEDMQQDFLICNTIGFLGVKQYDLDRDGFKDGDRTQVRRGLGHPGQGADQQRRSQLPPHRRGRRRGRRPLRVRLAERDHRPHAAQHSRS